MGASKPNGIEAVSMLRCFSPRIRKSAVSTCATRRLAPKPSSGSTRRDSGTASAIALRLAAETAAMPPDDASVADSVDVYRLIPEFYVAWDEDDARWRVSSGAFQNSSRTDRMSVVLGDTLQEGGRSPENARRSKPEWYVVAIEARDYRAEEQGMERDPQPDEEAHGNAVGEKKKGRRRRFAELARWVVAP